jgi:subtilisin family serine protease
LPIFRQETIVIQHLFYSKLRHFLISFLFVGVWSLSSTNTFASSAFLELNAGDQLQHQSKLELGPGLTYSLGKGPSGMSVDATGLVRWNTTLDDVGESWFKIDISDAERIVNSEVVEYRVVDANNRAPMFTIVPSNISIPMNTEFAFQVAAQDDDGDPLQYRFVAWPESHELRLSPTGLLRWEGPLNINEQYSVTLWVEDNRLGRAQHDFKLTVGETGSDLLNSVVVTKEDTPVSIPLHTLGGISGQGLIEQLPAHGQVNLSGETFIYTPDQDYFGHDNFSYSLNSELSAGNEARVELTISPVNDEPIIHSAPITNVTAGTQYQYRLDASDIDSELTYTLNTAPEGLTLDEDGTLQWQVPSDASGDYAVSIGVSDGEHFVSQDFDLRVEAPQASVTANVSIDGMRASHTFISVNTPLRVTFYASVSSDVPEHRPVIELLQVSEDGSAIANLGEFGQEEENSRAQSIAVELSHPALEKLHFQARARTGNAQEYVFSTVWDIDVSLEPFAEATDRAKLVQDAPGYAFYPYDEVVVILNEDVSILEAEPLAEHFAAELVGLAPISKIIKLRVPVDTPAELQSYIDQLDQDERVYSASKNFIPSTSAVANDASNLSSTRAQPFRSIKAFEAWDTIERYNQDHDLHPVTVGFIDTGVDVNHPEFNGVNISCYDAYPLVVPSHGTSVGSVIGGSSSYGRGWSFETNGMLGGVPFNVPAVSSRVPYTMVHGSTVNPFSHIEKAIRDGAQIINMSFGGYLDTGNLPEQAQEIFVLNFEEFSLEIEKYRLLFESHPQVLFVSSAGNEGVDVANEFPGGIFAENHITVGGSNYLDDVEADYNYGRGVQIVAPSEDIYVADVPRASEYGYQEKSGTSFAAPFVSGSAGLILSINPSLTPSLIKTLLQNTSDFVDSTTQYQGGDPIEMGGPREGLAYRLNAGDAVGCVAQESEEFEYYAGAGFNSYESFTYLGLGSTAIGVPIEGAAFRTVQWGAEPSDRIYLRDISYGQNGTLYYSASIDEDYDSPNTPVIRHLSSEGTIERGPPSDGYHHRIMKRGKDGYLYTLSRKNFGRHDVISSYDEELILWTDRVSVPSLFTTGNDQQVIDFDVAEDGSVYYIIRNAYSRAYHLDYRIVKQNTDETSEVLLAYQSNSPNWRQTTSIAIHPTTGEIYLGECWGTKYKSVLASVTHMDVDGNVQEVFSVPQVYHRDELHADIGQLEFDPMGTLYVTDPESTRVFRKHATSDTFALIYDWDPYSNGAPVLWQPGNKMKITTNKDCTVALYSQTENKIYRLR